MRYDRMVYLDHQECRGVAHIPFSSYTVLTKTACVATPEFRNIVLHRLLYVSLDTESRHGANFFDTATNGDKVGIITTLGFLCSMYSCGNASGLAYTSMDPLCWHRLILIPAWIDNHRPTKVWDEITYPFPNFNGATVEVWEWISNSIPDFKLDAIIYPRS